MTETECRRLTFNEIIHRISFHFKISHRSAKLTVARILNSISDVTQGHSTCSERLKARNCKVPYLKKARVSITPRKGLFWYLLFYFPVPLVRGTAGPTIFRPLLTISMTRIHRLNLPNVDARKIADFVSVSRRRDVTSFTGRRKWVVRAVKLILNVSGTRFESNGRFHASRTS